MRKKSETDRIRDRLDALERLVGNGWYQGMVWVPYEDEHSQCAHGASLCEIASKAVSYMGMKYKRPISGAITCPDSVQPGQKND